MIVVGISSYYHDSACCVLKDGKIIAVAEEERFSRIKFDSSLPQKAFKYCLSKAGCSINDVDCIAYYENPVKKLERQLCSGYDYKSARFKDKLNPNRPINEIREILGFEGKVLFFDHHMCHAASSFYYSGFENAAILTVDGVGEWATTTYAIGTNNLINIFEEVHFPNSLGLLYGTITNYLGFSVNSDEYKVMGLAPYGNATYVDKLYKLIDLGEEGQYTLNMDYFDFNGEKMFNERLVELLGQAPREKDGPITKVYEDIACSLQIVLEEILIKKAKYLYNLTGLKNLCMAGGVALNCVANSKVLKQSPFENLYVQPAANDAGNALGAAALATIKLNKDIKIQKMSHVYYGPSYTNKSIEKLLEATSLQYEKFENVNDLTKKTAKLLADGKVIGWFQGQMEFGPRALGARSILGDPRNPEMRDRINKMVKKREAFRPFAPSILLEKTNNYFDLDHPSPFMLETCNVISPISLPAITHVNGSARVQTVDHTGLPVYRQLLIDFEILTGCPIVLNTSFNIKGEPIVCSPEDALKCFITTDIDGLVMGNYYVNKHNNSIDVLRTILTVLAGITNSRIINEDVYTFL